MAKAIETRYAGPTNTRGARIIATDGDGNRVTVPYDHSKSHEAVHFVAVKRLCEKMNWHGLLECGSTTRGYVFVWTLGQAEWRV